MHWSLYFDRFDIETLFRKHTAKDDEIFKQAKEHEEKIVHSAIAKDSNETFGRLASNGLRINTDCLQVRKLFVNMLTQKNARLLQN